MGNRYNVSCCPDEIAEHHFKSQNHFLTYGQNLSIKTTTIPLEKKDTLLKQFLSKYVSNSNFTNRNKSQRKDQDYMTQFYTPKLIKLVNQRYRMDFKYGDYLVL